MKSILDLRMGDKIVIVKEKNGGNWNVDNLMDKHLGQTLVVDGIIRYTSSMFSAAAKGWCWSNEMIDWEETTKANQEYPDWYL